MTHDPALVEHAAAAILRLVPLGYGMRRDEAHGYAIAALDAADQWHSYRLAEADEVIATDGVGQWRNDAITRHSERRQAGGLSRGHDDTQKSTIAED